MMTGAFTLAIHGLIFLSRKQHNQSSAYVACNICTNAARVRRVMGMLAKKGLVLTQEGVQGGYKLAKNPENITLRQVAEAVEVRLVEFNWHSGSDDIHCQIASGMANAMDGLYDELNQGCLMQLEKITVADMEKRIFGNAKDGEE